MGNIVFLILTIMFVSVMLLYLNNAGKSNTLIEKIYAKKICLVIDSMKPGTEVEMSAPELFDYAEKNNYKSIYIIAQNASVGKITVRVANGDGFTYSYFGKIINIGIDNSNKSIIIKS